MRGPAAAAHDQRKSSEILCRSCMELWQTSGDWGRTCEEVCNWPGRAIVL